jgi:hypothetical protein
LLYKRDEGRVRKRGEDPITADSADVVVVVITTVCCSTDDDDVDVDDNDDEVKVSGITAGKGSSTLIG